MATLPGGTARQSAKHTTASHLRLEKSDHMWNLTTMISKFGFSSTRPWLQVKASRFHDPCTLSSFRNIMPCPRPGVTENRNKLNGIWRHLVLGGPVAWNPEIPLRVYYAGFQTTDPSHQLTIGRFKTVARDMKQVVACTWKRWSWYLGKLRNFLGTEILEREPTQTASRVQYMFSMMSCITQHENICIDKVWEY